MATEYKLSYTASEINRKLGMVDETASALENNYYTKDVIESTFKEFDAFVEDVSETLTTKADLVDGKVPLEQLPDNIGTGGGLTEVAWEDIKNKPFGQEDTELSWDGNAAGKERVMDEQGVYFVKITDTPILDIDGLIGGSMFIFMEGETQVATIEPEFIAHFGDDIDSCMYIVSVKAPGTATPFGSPVTFNSVGVYCFAMFPDDVNLQASSYVSSLSSVVYHKIDPVFLPDDIGGGVSSWNELEDKPFGEVGTKIEWDGAPTSAYETFDANGTLYYFYKVAEPVDTIIDGTAYITQMDGDIELPLSSDIVQVTDGGENGVYIMNVKVPNSVFAHPAGADITFREVGLYFFCVNMDGQEIKTTSFTASNYTIKKIDPKYLPIELDGSINMDNYYTKAEIDNMIGDCDSIISSINTLVGGGNV